MEKEIPGNTGHPKTLLDHYMPHPGTYSKNPDYTIVAYSLLRRGKADLPDYSRPVGQTLNLLRMFSSK